MDFKKYSPIFYIITSTAPFLKSLGILVQSITVEIFFVLHSLITKSTILTRPEFKSEKNYKVFWFHENSVKDLRPEHQLLPIIPKNGFIGPEFLYLCYRHPYKFMQPLCFDM